MYNYIHKIFTIFHSASVGYYNQNNKTDVTKMMITRMWHWPNSDTTMLLFRQWHWHDRDINQMVRLTRQWHRSNRDIDLTLMDNLHDGHSLLQVIQSLASSVTSRVTADILVRKEIHCTTSYSNRVTFLCGQKLLYGYKSFPTRIFRFNEFVN